MGHKVLTGFAAQALGLLSEFREDREDRWVTC